MNTSDSSPSTGIRLGAAVAVSLAVLLAAGCGGSKSSGTKNAAASGSAPTSSAGPAASSSGTVDGGASPSTAGSGSASTSLPAKPTSPASGGPRDCSTDMLKFTIQALPNPINHVMISATNVTQDPCHLNKYPLLLTYQSAKTPINAAAATKPASVVLLAPGATAYAGLMTNSADGSGTAGKNVPTLVLELQPSDAAVGGVGRPASVPMPANAQYIDSSAVVTYWETDLQSATY